MTDKPISPIIARHLDALLRNPTQIIPTFFQGATGKKQNGIYVRHEGLIPVDGLKSAMHALNPPDLFIRYTEAYIASPDLFERESVKVALISFIKQFDNIIDDIHQGEAGRYLEPDWKASRSLRGDDLTAKSTYMQKIHGMDAMIKNPNLLIAYAVMDAVFCDFYDEQRHYFKQRKPHDVLLGPWLATKGAAHVLHDILKHTGKPDIGFVHGPIMHGYFHHVQRYVNRGGMFGVLSIQDIREHLGALSPSGMFDGFGSECPLKGIFVAAALGVGRKLTVSEPRAVPRLWSVYLRAMFEAKDLQAQVTTSLEKYFNIAVLNMRGDFKRPQTRALAVIPAGGYSCGRFIRRTKINLPISFLVRA